MKKLAWVLGKNKGWVGLSLLMAVLSNASQIVYMFFVGELVNRIEERSVIETSFCFLMGAFLISNALTQYFSQLSSRYTAERSAHTLRMGFIRAKVYRTSGNSGSPSAAEAMSVVQNELNSANDYLSNTLFDMVGMSISGIVVFISLMIINIKLTMVVLIPTVLILMYVLWSGDKLSKIVKVTLDEKNNMNRIAYSAIDNRAVISIFGAKDFLLKTYDSSLDKWGKAEIKKDRLFAVYNSLSGVLSFLPLLLLLAAGAYMVISGEITVGTMIVFLSLHKSVTVFIMNMPSWIANFKAFTVNLSRIDVA